MEKDGIIIEYQKTKIKLQGQLENMQGEYNYKIFNSKFWDKLKSLRVNDYNDHGEN